MDRHSFSPALALNITDVEKFEVGKKLTGYFFLPGKKMTSKFLPRGRNGLAGGGESDRYTGCSFI